MTRFRRNNLFGWLGGSAAVLGLFTMMPVPSHAGGTIKIDDDRSISVGVGLRTSFNAIEGQAPDGTSRSKDFALDSARLFVSGQMLRSVSFEFNTEIGDDAGAGIGGGDVEIMDAVLKFAVNDYFNVWAGRFLPPSDRSNLSGPYYLNSWDFPFVQNYPNLAVGRDNGAAIWGQINKGQFKYQVGAFEGLGDIAAGPNQSDSLLYAGRLVLNLWDPEPGYYNSSTYYGDMKVLAFGLTAMAQSDAVGTAATPGDFSGWSLDVLAESELGGAGVGTIEGAYYDYDTDNIAASIPQGNGYFLLVSYLLPQKMGAGKLQPIVRYQSFETDPANVEHTRMDFGLNYIISGHNARISALFFSDDPGGAASDFNGFKLGLQFQI
ncbi:MAG: porin [Nitrospiria bacterium]